VRLLTIKSDDVVGRAKAYESQLLKVRISRSHGIPESFNVLLNDELEDWRLDIEFD
jgi:DNA-directed RNA polymerase subunit beta